MEIRFWTNQRGGLPVSGSIESLPEKPREKVFWVLELLEKHGTKLMHTKHMDKLKGYDLYELRIKYNRVLYRILVVIINTTSWLLHMFIKKSRHTPPNEINIALRRSELLKVELGVN